jgi:hypothetical protein
VSLICRVEPELETYHHLALGGPQLFLDKRQAGIGRTNIDLLFMNSRPVVVLKGRPEIGQTHLNCAG